MKYLIADEQLNILGDHLQSLIDGAIDSIREQSEEWGLGEMDELEEINSIDHITIDRIVPHISIKVYIDIHTKNTFSDREDFDGVRAEIQYRLEQWVPNIKVFINEIVQS